MADDKKLPIHWNKQASPCFEQAFTVGAMFTRVECGACGRVHYCDPNSSRGDYEEGEFENLERLREEKPETYFKHFAGSLSFGHVVGIQNVVFACQCNWSGRVEEALLNNHGLILDFYAAHFGLQKMEADEALQKIQKAKEAGA